MTAVALLQFRTFQLQQLLQQFTLQRDLLALDPTHFLFSRNQQQQDNNQNKDKTNTTTKTKSSSSFAAQARQRRCSNHSPLRTKSVLLFYLLTYVLLIGDAVSLSFADGASGSNIGNTFTSSPSSAVTPSHVVVVTSTNKNNGKVLKHYWSRRRSLRSSEQHDIDDTTQTSLLDQQQKLSPSSSSFSTPSSISSFLKRNNQKLSFLFLQEIPRTLTCTFLPIGYPHSTPPGYLSFAVWSSIQDLCTVARGVVATASVLQGVGVGSAQATAMAAVLQFLVRDGCGRLATLLFTAAAARRFRTNIKQWRLFADVMVDIGITCEVIAQYFSSHWFLFWICVGNMCKAVCGVAAGACAGAIQVHWASGRGGGGEEQITTSATTTATTTTDGTDGGAMTSHSSNAGTTDVTDIAAKFGAQNTVTGTIGLLLAAVFSKYLSSHHSHIWSMYILLTVLHIYANIRCMRWIAFDYLNTSRLKLAISHFLTANHKQQPEPQQQQPEQQQVMIPSRLEMSFKEPLFFSFNNKIILGVSFDEIVKLDPSILEQEQEWQQQQTKGTVESSSPPPPLSLLSEQPQSQIKKWYWIAQDRKKGRVLVAFREGIPPLEQAKAYFHSMLILHHQRYNKHGNWQESELESSWNAFVTACKAAGWNLNKTDLYTRGYEVSFDTEA